MLCDDQILQRVGWIPGVRSVEGEHELVGGHGFTDGGEICNLVGTNMNLTSEVSCHGCDVQSDVVQRERIKSKQVEECDGNHYDLKLKSIISIYHTISSYGDSYNTTRMRNSSF